MIYFIEAKTSGLIKIGYTRGNPNGRLSGCQTGSPEKLTGLAFMHGSQSEEHQLHVDFVEFWSHGEWFRDCPALREFILEYAQPWDQATYATLVAEALAAELAEAAEAEAERIAAEKAEAERWIYDRRLGRMVLKNPPNSFDLKELRRRLSDLPQQSPRPGE